MVKKKQRASALVSAIFITAIAAMIATAFMLENRLLIHNSELVISSDQGYLTLQGMQSVAKNAVQQYVMQWENAQTQEKTNIVPLSTQIPLMKINGMRVYGTVSIESGKFNINSLSNISNQFIFAALLHMVIPAYSQADSLMLAKNITAWLINPSPIPYYLNQHPPYQSAHQQFVNISELRLVEGVTPIIYLALKPYITALPVQLSSASSSTSNSPIPIDINSASAPLLAVYNPQLTRSEINNLVQCRQESGAFFNTQAFMNDCAVPIHIQKLNGITTNTQYFLSKITGERNHHFLHLNALWVTRPEKNNTLKIVTVWQEFE